MAVSIILPNNNIEQPAVIKIIGVGGGGTNAVNRMIAANVSNVEFYVVNTDLPTLRRSSADNKIQIGRDGLGVGGDPLKGEESAVESEEKLRDMLKGADMVFITTGMGGGTGTGAAPVIAKFAKDNGILTVGVVTKPFTVEGKIRIDYANMGIDNIKKYTDALIVIPNDRIFAVVDEKTPYEDGYKIIDDVLRRAIESITDTITKIGTVNIDFADVKRVLQNSDTAIIGLGDGESLEEAFNKALHNVFVEGPDIREAHNILINISCSRNNPFTIGDRGWLDDFIKKEFKHFQFLKPGNMVEDTLDTKVKVSIIASFNRKEDIKEDLFDDIRQQEKSVVADDDGIKVNNLKDDLFSRPAYEHWKIKRLK
ncbi:MAG: cell division protein FtsZ [Endomicrobiaceae bacterium]